MDDAPWMDKPTFIAHTGKSERTIQVWVREKKAERIIGEDGRALYRMARSTAAPRSDVAPRSDAAPPGWAVELQEDIRRLEAKLDALAGAQRAIAQPPAAPQHPRRSWWRRFLYGPG